MNVYLARMQALFWPDLFILGGAVSERFADFAPLLHCEAEVRPAHFGSQAGVIGAALAAAKLRGRASDAAGICHATFSRSKLPDVGTTIFTVMSRRARELGALNLGQGFPDYDIDPRLTELVAEAMRQGHNQYAPMEGVLELRERIAQKLAASYGVEVDPETQVTVTLGATEAIYSAIQAVVGPGDEAIAFDPAYDSYEPAVRLAGARCIRLPLMPPDFRYDWDRVRAAINSAHAADPFQQSAQSGLHGGDGRGSRCAGGDHSGARHLRAVGRGVRARRVRRPRARLGAVASGAAPRELRGVLVRQDTACNGTARRLLRRRRRC